MTLVHQVPRYRGTSVPASPAGASIVAVANQKGGVGKTTVALGLAEAMSVAGHRVLVVDADAQADLTDLFRGELDGDSPTLATLYERGNDSYAADAVARRVSWGFDLVPADTYLANAEHRRGETAIEQRLRRILHPVRERYDAVLIDCPPSLSLLTVSSLIAADRVLLVTQPRYFSVKQVGNLLETVDVVRANYNDGLALLGVVVNQWRAQRREGELRVAELDEFFGSGVVWRPFVPDLAAVEESASDATPLRSMRRPGALRSRLAFDALAKRFVEEQAHAGA